MHLQDLELKEGREGTLQHGPGHPGGRYRELPTVIGYGRFWAWKDAYGHVLKTVTKR